MTFATFAGWAGVHAIGWTLLHFLWQGSAIGATLWLVLAILPRPLAPFRYAACCMALGLMLLAPVVTLAQRLSAEPGGSSLVEGVAPLPPGPAFLFLSLSVGWAIGSAFMSLRLALGVTRLRRVVARATPVSGEWQKRVDALALALGLLTPVRLITSGAVDAPLTLGWLRPVIVLPLSALGSLPATYLEALLLHELAHVRRLDYLVNAVQAGAEALLFYHPAVHWVSERLRIEREHCCDDVAINILGDRIQYARALTAMESSRTAVPLPALGSNGGSLLARIERIVQAPARRPPRRAPAAIAGALAACAGLALAAASACGVSADGPSTDSATRAQRALDVAWFPPELLRYESTLTSAAERHGIDPTLLAIVTLVESLADPSAHSPGGAVGLMQLMPATAASIAAERSLDDYSESRLWEPDYNIDLGAWYLSRQFAAFASDGLTERGVARTAMAYNCGPRLARAIVAGDVEAPEEAQRYRDLVVALWRDRALAQSASFTQWNTSVRERRDR